MSAFPAHPDDITADWWNATLGRVPDRWRWEPIGTGQVGDSVRFTLDFAGEARPVTLAGKFAAADPNSRGTAAMLGLYTKEVRFYRELAPQLPIRTPNTLFAEIAEDGASFSCCSRIWGRRVGGNRIAGCIDVGDADDDCRAGGRLARTTARSVRQHAAIRTAPLPDPAAACQNVDAATRAISLP